jgi:preprotein translocase subunit SecG
MSFKTLFIIIVSVLVTIILMNNTEEIDFWIFGDAEIPKLAVLGFMFGLGLIVGYLAGRPGKKSVIKDDSENDKDDYINSNTEKQDQLSDEDREYIR